MLFPIRNDADDPHHGNAGRQAEVVNHLGAHGGRCAGSEQELSLIEQMLVEQLAFTHVMGTRAYAKYKRATIHLWCSVAANVAMLIIFWL